MKGLRGFSIMELLAILAIVAILCLFFLPFGTQVLDKNHIARVEKEIINSIRYARTMAMVMGNDIALNALSGTEDWSDGVLVFIDNKSHYFSTKDKQLWQWQWHARPLQVKWQGFHGKDYLIVSSNLSKASANGYFAILYQQKEVGRIVLNRMGRVLD